MGNVHDSVLFPRHSSRHPGGMFLHLCTVCGYRGLVGVRSVVGVINTERGPLAVIRCPEGHETVVDVHEPVTGVA